MSFGSNPFGSSSFGGFAGAPAAATGNNATLNITEASDTLAATATVLVSPSLAVTEAGDSLSASTAILVQANAAITEGADTLSATAQTLNGNNASLAITEASDTLAAAAQILVTASLNATEAPDVVINGNVSAFAFLVEDADRIFASVQRTSYIPFPKFDGTAFYVTGHGDDFDAIN